MKDHEKWSREDRLLLHLYKYSTALLEKRDFYPVELTQEGIEERVRVNSKHIAQLVRSINKRASDLNLGNFIQLADGRVLGKRRIRKIYSLTEEGVDYAGLLFREPSKPKATIEAIMEIAREEPEIEKQLHSLVKEELELEKQVKDTITTLFILRGFEKIKSGFERTMAFSQKLVNGIKLEAIAYVVYEKHLTKGVIDQLRIMRTNLPNLTVVYGTKTPDIDLDDLTELGSFVTVDKLLISMFSAEAYLRDVISRYDDLKRKEHEPKTNLLGFYEPVYCNTVKGRRLDCEKYLLEEWLPSNSRCAVVRGDLGTGKTWLASKIVYELAKRFLENPAENRIPILIDFKEPKISANIEDLLYDYFAKKVVGEKTAFPRLMIRQLLQSGKLLVILDGFDEMAQAMIDEEKMREDLRTLLKATLTENSKTVITSRRLYLKWIRPYELIDFVSKSEEEGHRFEKKEQRTTFEIIDLLGFPRKSVESYVASLLSYERKKKWVGVIPHLPEKESILRLVEEHRLFKMVKNPFLCYLFMKGSFEKAPLDMHHILEKAIEEWWDRDTHRFRQNLGLKLSPDKLKILRSSFMDELSLEILKNKGIRKISNNMLDDFILRYVKQKRLPFGGLDLSAFQISARMSTFLMSDREGRFGFIHDDFLYYFAAHKLFECIGNCECKYFAENRVTLFPPLEDELYISPPIQRFLSIFLKSEAAKDGVDIRSITDAFVEEGLEYSRPLRDEAKSNILQLVAQVVVFFGSKSKPVEKEITQVSRDEGEKVYEEAMKKPREIDEGTRWRFFWALSKLQGRPLTDALQWTNKAYAIAFKTDATKRFENFLEWVTYVIGQSAEIYRPGNKQDLDWLLQNGKTCDALLKLLDEKKSSVPVIKAICWTLGQIGDEKSVTALNGLLHNDEMTEVHDVAREALHKITGAIINREIVENRPKLLTQHRYTLFTPRIDECQIHKYFFKYKEITPVDCYRSFIKSNLKTGIDENLAWLLSELAGAFDDILGFEKRDKTLDTQISDFREHEAPLSVNWNFYWAHSKVLADPMYREGLTFSAREYVTQVPGRRQGKIEDELRELRPWVAFGLGQMVFLYMFEDEETYEWALGGYGTESALEQLLEALRTGETTKLRLAAAWAIGLFGTETAKKRLVETRNSSYKDNGSIIALQIGESIRKINSLLLLWDVLHVNYDRVAEARYSLFSPLPEDEFRLDPQIFANYARLIEASDMKPVVRKNVQDYLQIGIDHAYWQDLNRSNILWFMTELATAFSDYITTELIDAFRTLQEDTSVDIEVRWDCYCLLSKIHPEKHSFLDVLDWTEGVYRTVFILEENEENQDTRFGSFLEWCLGRTRELLKDNKNHKWLFGRTKEEQENSINKIKQVLQREQTSLQKQAIDILGRIPYLVTKEEKLINQCVRALKSKFAEKRQPLEDGKDHKEIQSEVLRALLRIEVSKLGFDSVELPEEKMRCLTAVREIEKTMEIPKALADYVDKIKEPIVAARLQLREFTLVEHEDYNH